MVTVRATTPLGDALRYAAAAFLEAANEADAEQPLEFLTPRQIAETLKVHDETVYRWIRAKQLPAVEVGGKYRVRRSDLDDFLEARSG
jgi:excisionase family DNA binding protein